MTVDGTQQTHARTSRLQLSPGGGGVGVATRESGLKGFPFFALGDPVQPFQGGLVAWRGPLRVEAWIRETLLLENEVLSVDLSSWVSTKSFCTSRKRWKGWCRSPGGGGGGAEASGGRVWRVNVWKSWHGECCCRTRWLAGGLHN